MCHKESSLLTYLDNLCCKPHPCLLPMCKVQCCDVTPLAVIKNYKILSQWINDHQSQRVENKNSHYHGRKKGVSKWGICLHFLKFYNIYKWKCVNLEPSSALPTFQFNLGQDLMQVKVTHDKSMKLDSTQSCTVWSPEPCQKWSHSKNGMW